MRARSVRVVLMAVVVLMALVIAVVPSFAQSGATGMNNWQTLAPGQQVEYRLQFKGSGSGPVTVMVGSNPTNAVGFKVYTDQAWASSGDPVGQGTVQKTTGGNPAATPSALYGDALVWQTNDPSGQLFHIQITNLTQANAQYWIDATGAGNGGLSMYNSAALSSASGASGTSTTTTNQTGTGTTTAQGPRTLPVTGGETSNLVVYMTAGLGLLAAGWLVSRKAVQR
jgi:hypothetical protein